MRSILAITLPLVLAASCAPAQPAPVGPTGGGTQMVVVTTNGWDSVGAVLTRYEREAPGRPWRAAGEPIPAAVGRTGLAWGTGLHPEQADGPRKREGDGKAPAGIFALSSAFGYAAAVEAAWVRMPYVQADESVECVDDGRSRYYNRRVDRDTIAQPDWTSHEELRRPDHLYRWGVWVDHNSSPPRPMGGSCIFLHIWARPGAATSGCTAMAEDDLLAVLRWLEPAARPVLVQLPADRYAALRGAWALP